jgi:uncharacterized membrane protein
VRASARSIYKNNIFLAVLAVVGVLHQQHFSAIENHLQKNNCQVEKQDIIKILAVVGVLHQQHFSAIENHFQKNKCQVETPDIKKQRWKYLTSQNT